MKAKLLKSWKQYHLSVLITFFIGITSIAQSADQTTMTSRSDEVWVELTPDLLIQSSGKTRYRVLCQFTTHLSLEKTRERILDFRSYSQLSSLISKVQIHPLRKTVLLQVTALDRSFSLLFQPLSLSREHVRLVSLLPESKGQSAELQLKALKPGPFFETQVTLISPIEVFKTPGPEGLKRVALKFLIRSLANQLLNHLEKEAKKR